MKLSKFGVITLLLFGMVIALAGIVCADQPVPAVPETQTLGTVTIADVDGIAMETDAGTWTLTYDPMHSLGLPGPGSPIWDSAPYTNTASHGFIFGNWNTWPAVAAFNHLDPSWAGFWAFNLDPSINGIFTPEYQAIYDYAVSHNLGEGGIHTGALDPGQIQYTTAYDANIVAQAGHTSFVKSMNIDTRNKVIGQSNIDAKTALTYIATAEGGNAVGSENIMLDGAGNATTAADKMLCPFASAGGNVIPAYCNIIQAGSKYDLTVGSVTTAANDKFVGSDATIPVVLNYAINVKAYTASGSQYPATGSAMAYIKAHIQEGNNFNTTKAEDLTYSETSSVNGYIYSFNKVIAYQSGKSLL